MSGAGTTSPPAPTSNRNFLKEARARVRRQVNVAENFWRAVDIKLVYRGGGTPAHMEILQRMFKLIHAKDTHVHDWKVHQAKKRKTQCGNSGTSTIRVKKPELPDIIVGSEIPLPKLFHWYSTPHRFELVTLVSVGDDHSLRNICHVEPRVRSIAKLSVEMVPVKLCNTKCACTQCGLKQLLHQPIPTATTVAHPWASLS